eukprot:gene19042-20955_t
MNFDKPSLVQYSDSADSDVEEKCRDESDNESSRKRKKFGKPKLSKKAKLQKSVAPLPLPNDIKSMFQEAENATENPVSHAGRVRSFAHVDGDWASFVYIPVKPCSSLLSTLKKIHATAKLSFPNLQTFGVNDFHITLSRTVSLRHYWIETIISKLRDEFSSSKSFSFHLDLPELYTNDEKTRTFIGLRVILGESKLEKLSRKVDKVFSEFGLPGYYEHPSFHMSIAWHLGDVTCIAPSDLQESLQEILESTSHNDTSENPRILTASQIVLKCGKKIFTLINL